jgi:gentisate 1,2-dioxygenase
MPTIGTFAQRLPAGFMTRPYRSSDSSVHVCLEGSGRATIGAPGETVELEFSTRDIFVVPSWQAFSLAANEDTLVFSFSDRPVQQVLGLWREERLA